MSRQLKDLDPSFESKARDLIENTRNVGFEMRPFFTLRSPIVQAKLWRQSRSTKVIRNKIKEFRSGNCGFLADCLEVIGPQLGRWATNAPPGFSWHNWGMAIDCFYMDEDGIAVWDAEHVAYQKYAEEAISMGLTSGYFWRQRDAVHVQLHQQSVSQMYSPEHIDKEMKVRFEPELAEYPRN